MDSMLYNYLLSILQSEYHSQGDRLCFAEIMLESPLSDEPEQFKYWLGIKNHCKNCMDNIETILSIICSKFNDFN